MGALLQDLRFGLRVLAKARGFTAIAILTLALGIGGNTALFSVVNGVLLNPLPYPDAHRLFAVYTAYSDGTNGTFSFPNFLDWKRDNRTFAFLAAYHPDEFTLTGAGGTERIPGERISADFFEALGVRPLFGRTFTKDDDRVAGAPVILLSEGFWRRRLGAEPNVLQRSVALDGASYTVVGVIPATFRFSGNGFSPADVYVPITQWAVSSMQNRSATLDNYAIGKLGDGVTLAQARADMDAIGRRLAVLYPNANKDTGIAIVSLKKDIVGGVSALLSILLTSVGFVLLIACVNVANLLLARSTGRMREFAVRASLGATRHRLIRQLLTESVLLALAGGLLGLLLAAWGTKWALDLLPKALPRASEVGLDTRVLLFTLGISTLAGVLFGLAPALRISHRGLQESLREGGRGSSGRGRGLQRVFIVSEMALALVLLCGAGLMVRTLIHLSSVDPGFNPHNALTFRVALGPALAEAAPAVVREHFRQFTANLESLAGVKCAAASAGPLPMQGDLTIPFWRESQPKPPSDNDMPESVFLQVQPNFLKAMQIPLLHGRFINDQDTMHSPIVIAIDEVLAQKYFPGEDPVGKQVNLAIINLQAQIVGVVGHVKYYGPADGGSSATHAQLYFPYMQVPDAYVPTFARQMQFVVRTDAPPPAMVASIRAMVEKMNNQQAIFQVASFDRIVSDSVASQRFTTILLGVFAALALALASIGIYGVIAYLVGQRTREIGLRIACGAQRGDVLRLILGEGAALALAGVLIGVAAAFALTRVMEELLFGVSARDPLTFLGVACLLMFVALFASYMPARRAMGVDPVVALRHE